MADPLILRWLIDHVLRQRRWQPAVAVIGLLLASALLRLGLMGAGNLLTATVLQRVILRLRSRLFGQVQRMPAAFYDSRPIGDLVFRLEQDIDQVAQLGTDILPSVVRMIMVSVFVLAAMFFLNWRLACLGVVFMPIFMLMRTHFRKLLEAASNRSRNAAGERSSFVTESLAGAQQIQLLGAERAIGRKYWRLAADAVRASLSQRKVELSYALGSLAIVSVATAVVLGAGAIDVIRGAFTVGSYVAFYSYLGWLFEPLSAALELYSRFQRASASIRRIREIENDPAALGESAPVSGARRPALQTIRCDGVEFAYPGGQTALLNLDVELRAGEKVALVGRSGSGKSTLAKLLVRFYDAGAGAVQFDGTDVRDLDPALLRRSIAFVPQDPVLFRGTVRDNLLLGRGSADDDELTRAVYVSCFNDVLNKLPDGWLHQLGPFGSGLSGGEKQRLALARALLQDRPFLVLDEATSALDPAVEAELLCRLKLHAKDKAVLLISHRPSHAEWADRVIVLEAGSVVPSRNGQLQDLQHGALPNRHCLASPGSKKEV
jgi:ABC-type multidrug transport system fused ATPase/permease subunit